MGIIDFNNPNRECCLEEERAAIMEYEGGMTRQQAEKESGLTALKNRQLINSAQTKKANSKL